MTAKMAKVSSKTKSPAASGTVRTASAEASMADQPPAATDAIETAGDADDAMQMSDDEEGNRVRVIPKDLDKVFYCHVER